MAVPYIWASDHRVSSSFAPLTLGTKIERCNGKADVFCECVAVLSQQWPHALLPVSHLLSLLLLNLHD